jgi:hypothetical protein
MARPPEPQELRQAAVHWLDDVINVSLPHELDARASLSACRTARTRGRRGRRARSTTGIDQGTVIGLTRGDPDGAVA